MFELLTITIYYYTMNRHHKIACKRKKTFAAHSIRRDKMYQVRKRDGQIIEFNLSKIAKAITAAFDAKNKPYTQDIIDLLADRKSVV